MEKVKKLKSILKKEKIDGYFIPKNDQFFEEHISHNNDRLNYISNFSGSLGYALILKNINYLFVDGRYTQQAFKQSGKFFKIITMPKQMPKDVLKKKRLVIGFDPKLFTKKNLEIFFNKSNCTLKPLKFNLIDMIWRRKIEISRKKFFILPNHSVDEKYEFKINRAVSDLKKKDVDFLFITACENSAWLLNIRGYDVNFSPIPHCYILINKDKSIKLFCDLRKISSSFKKRFKKVKFFSLDRVHEILSKIFNKKFIIDKNTCSYDLEKIIAKKNKILSFGDPIYNYKAIKSKKEIINIKKAHIYDGLALTKFLFWLKRNFNKKTISEISASRKLYNFRKKNKNFKFLSFPTISGTGPNGAIIHYQPTKKTNRILRSGDIYLVDSGGQYEFGTTDVTRTISLKNKSSRIRKIFTRVLKGHIAVADFRLKDNTTGSNIDTKARKSLKNIGLDYSHGTGHGVGYFLNVHEGPQAISKNNKVKFKEGMIVSNEPGYYEKNKFGIRIENLIYVKKKRNRKYFEDLTMAPIDKNLIDKKLLNKNEKLWLNKYHRKVFNNFKNSMNKLEKIELREACSAI